MNRKKKKKVKEDMWCDCHASRWSWTKKQNPKRKLDQNQESIKFEYHKIRPNGMLKVGVATTHWPLQAINTSQAPHAHHLLHHIIK